MPLAERAHFGQHKNAKALYDAITLYYIVTRLPDSLSTNRDLLALDHTDLTLDLLEKHLLVAETSRVAVGTSRGTPCTPFFEGCSPSPLVPPIASATAVDFLCAEEVGAASSPSGRRRNNKGKGGQGGGGGSARGGGGVGGGGGGGGGGSGSRGGSGGVGGGGGGGGGGRSGSGGDGNRGSSGGGGGSSGGGCRGAVPRGGSGGDQRQQQQCPSENPSPQQLREWFAQRGASGGSVRCPYVIRMGDRAGQTCGKPHTLHRYFSRLNDTWRAEFGDKAERPCWAELLRSGVAIFALDFDAILAAMYALSISAERDCYLCVPPDPGIEAAALGASESALPGTAPAEALHTFTLDSSASRTTLTPLSARVPVTLADPSRGPVLARSSTVLPCPGFTSGSLSGIHLPHSLRTCKGEVLDVLIPRIRAVRLQLRERLREDLPDLRLHSDRGGEFSSNLLRDFCRGEGILKTFTRPASPQQNGIAERRIGLVMEPLAPCLLAGDLAYTRLTGKVGDASMFWVWGSRAFVRDMSTDKLSACAIPFVFLGYPPDAPGWQFYHPTWRRVISSQDVTLDKSVPFYRLFPFRSTPPPPPPLFLAPGPPSVDPLPSQGPAPSALSQVDPPIGVVPVEVASDSSAARGAASGGAASGGAGSGGVEPGGAEPAGVEPGGAEREGVEPGGADSESAESRCAEPWGTASSGGPTGASPRQSPLPEPVSLQQLREWFAQPTRLQSGAVGAGDSSAGYTGAKNVGTTRLGGAGVIGGAGGIGGAAAVGPGGACTKGTGAAGTGSVGGTGAGGSGDIELAELELEPLKLLAQELEALALVALEVEELELETVGLLTVEMEVQELGVLCLAVLVPEALCGRDLTSFPYFSCFLVSSSASLTPPLLCPPPDQSQLPLQLASPVPAPSPYTEQTGGLTECCEPESRPASPVRAVRNGRRVPHTRPPPLPGTHAMALRPSSIPLRVPLPPPPKSSLPAVLDPESDLAPATSPTISHLLATVVTDPSFEYTTASALVPELVDFAAACRHSSCC
ncbi:unnamed protein product [Closterium sp. NIES-53]